MVSLMKYYIVIDKFNWFYEKESSSIGEGFFYDYWLKKTYPKGQHRRSDRSKLEMQVALQVRLVISCPI